MVQSPAGFWVRLIARLLDGIIVGAVVGIIALVLGFSMRGTQGLSSLIDILYFIIVPVAWIGYTIGKRAFGIRVAKVDGSPLGIGSMILREFVGFGLIYGITFGIALIVSCFMIGLRQDKRGIHDLIAGTYVTREPAPAKEA